MPRRAAKAIEADRTEVADRLARGELSEEEAAEKDAKLVAELTGESSESVPSTDR